jgi:Tol biopolymer transport system component
VAIKVLAPELAGEPASRARFLVEARAIARLSHPRICAIHDIARQKDVDFLVMELLAGETLRQRLDRKPMTVAEALRVGIEIAEALDAAHGQGIVHRDLKPGNVMLTGTGAKLLDFGLARLRAGGTQEKPLDEQTDRNMPGLILGTLRYMAPEQLEGGTVDQRADVFAFGIVLYEMLTGEAAFEGNGHAGVIAAILSSDPAPVSGLQPLAPPSLERLIRACLEKNPDQRCASMHDVLVLLRWIAAEGRDTSAGTGDRAGRFPNGRIAWAALLAIVGMFAVAGWSRWRVEQPPPALVMRVLSVAPLSGTVLSTESPPAVSVDGRRLAFVAIASNGQQLLFHLALDSYDRPQPLSNTEGAQFPFWSPDGTRIGFFADGQLKTVDVSSGLVHSLAPAGQPRGGTWNRDDVIVFVPRPMDGPYRIAATGGAAEQLDLDVPHGAPRGWYPSFLPNGRDVLIYTPSGRDPDQSNIAVISLDARTRTPLVTGARSNGVYAAPGHLLYWRDGSLMAQPFDAGARVVRGNPVALPAAVGANLLTNQALMSVSSSATLAFFGAAAGATQLEWVDRTGKRIGRVGPAGIFNSIALSPDGASVVYDEAAARTGSVDLQRYDFSTGQVSRRTFNASHDMFPMWSRDGRIFFNSLRTGIPQIFQLDANNTGNEQQILQRPFPTLPSDVTADGRLLIYHATRTGTGGDVFALQLDRGMKEFAVLESAANEGHATLSPDGKFLAYVSNENKSYEVYVQRFPMPDGKRQVSVNGGFEPNWRADGRELFFLAPDRTLMSVSVGGTTGRFDHGPPHPLFSTRIKWLENQAGGRHYAPSPDGQRFVIANASDEARTTPITIVLNWAASIGR